MAQKADLNQLYDYTEKLQHDIYGGGAKLNMKEEDFYKAVAIIATSLSCKAQFIVPINGNYSHTHDILIQESNASLINKLICEGYSLSMTPKGLSVTKY